MAGAPRRVVRTGEVRLGVNGVEAGRQSPLLLTARRPGKATIDSLFAGFLRCQAPTSMLEDSDEEDYEDTWCRMREAGAAMEGAVSEDDDDVAFIGFDSGKERRGPQCPFALKDGFEDDDDDDYDAR
eukprot:6180293-Pleurochrysis_carterae.AAC.1